MEPNIADIQNLASIVEEVQDEEPSVLNMQDIKPKKEKKKVYLTIKKLQECILKIENKKNSKEKYMLKLVEKVGKLAKAIDEDARMKNKEINGTIEGELQDILYYVTCLSNLYEMDLEECIYLKEEINCKKNDRENVFKDEQD